MSVRRLLILSWLLLLSAFLAGCEGADSTITRVDTQGNVREVVSDDAVFQDNVRLVTADFDDQVASMDATSITLTGESPWQIGDVIIKGEGLSQFTRRVTGISQVGGQTVVTTERVGFEDIFKEADIQETINMGPEFLSSLTPAIPGVTFGEPVQVNAQSNEIAAFGLPVNFSDAILDQNGRGSVALNGNIVIRLAIRTELQIGLFTGFERVALVPKVTVSGALTATGTGSGDFRQEFPLCPKFSYPLVGYGPIGLNLGGQLVITVDGYIQSEGKVSVSGEVILEGGVEGRNNQFYPVHSFTPSYTVEAPSFLANATLNLSLLQPKLNVSLADMGQVWVSAALLKLECEARATALPQPGYDVRVYRNFSVDAGYSLDLGPLYDKEEAFPIVSGQRVEVAQLGVPLPPLPSDEKLTLVRILSDGSPMRLGEERVLPTLQIQFMGFFPVPALDSLTWQSSDPNVVRLTDFGFCAVARAVGAGSSNIMASPRLGAPGVLVQPVSASGLTGISLVGPNVNAQALIGDEVRGQTTATLKVPEFGSRQLQAIGTYADGSAVDLTYTVNWGTDDNARAFRNGQIDGGIQGGSSLRLTNPLTGQIITTPVEVVREPVSFLNIFPLQPTDAEVETGQTLQLRSNGRFADNSVREVTRFVDWSSSDNSVATVEDGLVEPIRSGEVIITVADPNGSATYSKRVIVNQAPMVRLELSPSETPEGAEAGDEISFAAVAVHADGARFFVSDKAIWRITNTSVGSITNTGLLTLRFPGRIGVKALYNGFTASSAKFDVKGPALMVFSEQPSDLGPEEPFQVKVEIRDQDNELWTKPLPVTLELLGGSDQASLAGTITRNTVNGVATFSGLSIDEIGEGYTLQAVSSGLPLIRSESFDIAQSGPTPGNLVGHLFVGDRAASNTAIYSAGVTDNGVLDPASGGESALQDTPEGIVRLGQYLYAATTGPTAQDNVIVGFSYAAATGVLTPIDVFEFPSTFASFFQPMFLASNTSDALILLAGTERFMYSFNVDSGNGELSGNASFLVKGSGSAGGILYYDVPGDAQDRVFVSMRDDNQVQAYGFDNTQGRVYGVEVMNPSDVDSLATYNNPVAAMDGGSPAAMAVVGNNLFVANINGDDVSHFVIDPTTQALTPAATSSFQVGTAPTALHASGNFLYVANSAAGSISVFSVTGNTVAAVNGGTPYNTTALNPHSFTEIGISLGQSVLYVANSTNVDGFLRDTVTGLLTPITAGSIPGLTSPGEIRR